MTRGNPSAFVRRMTRDDISAIVDLQSRIFPGMNPWKPRASRPPSHHLPRRSARGCGREWSSVGFGELTHH